MKYFVLQSNAVPSTSLATRRQHQEVTLKQWVRRARGAIGTGITWALVWAPVAVVLGTQVIDPDNSMDEMWVVVGALPGFLSGVAFSVVLSILARRRRLEDLSVARVAGWGALAGALIGTLPFILGDSGGRPWIVLAGTVIASLSALGALSAAGSLAVAQRAITIEPEHELRLLKADAFQSLKSPAPEWADQPSRKIRKKAAP